MAGGARWLEAHADRRRTSKRGETRRTERKPCDDDVLGDDGNEGIVALGALCELVRTSRLRVEGSLGGLAEVKVCPASCRNKTNPTSVQRGPLRYARVPPAG